jgi:hypothetical protein
MKRGNCISKSVDGGVAGPALRAVDEEAVNLIILGVHQDRPKVAAQKINGVRTGRQEQAAHLPCVRGQLPRRLSVFVLDFS